MSMSMSSAALPSRRQCIQDTGNYCQCPWFASSLLDQNICGLCGHGIHAHVDYVSMVIHHYPARQCAEYVQKTPLTQRCTCEAQLCDHVPTDNLYRSAEPWTVLDYFTDSNSTSYDASAISFSNGAINDPMSFSPADPNIVTFSHDASVMPIIATPTFSPSPCRTFSPSSDVGNIPLVPTSISSPSSSASSGIQSDSTQIQACSSHNYFFQYSGHFMNDSYTRQPNSDATNESFEYQDYSNMSCGAMPGAGADDSSDAFA
ncbi:hypothetical protein ARMGADRAFT_77895 [Armillaria gallica]|uniref:Uncharacterized protein n=1 Tax=Armillaria gallica TaxID=47427 RepID=A0A2H3CBG3_ARMGA|nr:hypothetical protein ARMGADRAFT_77895 [Armillaria gallica]